MTAANLLVPAAQYLRVSTEHQQYSLENQSAAIQKYAESSGFGIVHSSDLLTCDAEYKPFAMNLSGRSQQCFLTTSRPSDTGEDGEANCG